MNKLIYIYFFLSTLFLIVPNQVRANDATDAFKKEQLGSSRISAEDFAKATKGLNYVPKKPKPDPDIDFPDLDPDIDLPDIDIDPPSFDGFAAFLKILLWVVAGGIILFIIARLFLMVNIKDNKKVEDIDDPEKLLNHIEENLHKVDVEGFLSKALAAGDYRLATRLYFLAIMKELSLKKMILWKKDKTNGRYLTEMYRHKAYYDRFRKITRVFEYAWYSERSFMQKDFEQVRPQFKDLLTSVKKAKTATVTA